MGRVLPRPVRTRLADPRAWLARRRSVLHAERLRPEPRTRRYEAGLGGLPDVPARPFRTDLSAALGGVAADGCPFGALSQNLQRHAEAISVPGLHRQCASGEQLGLHPARDLER